MWTRKASLLTGLGLTLTALGVIARSPGALGAGLVLLAFVLVNRLLFRDTALVEAKRKLDLFRIFEGDSTQVDVTITNPGKRLLFLEVRDRLPRQVRVAEGGSAYDQLALPARGSARLRYELNAPLLGVYEIGPTDLRLEDPFGLFFEERSVTASEPVWVLPRTEDLRKAALISKLPLPVLGDHQVNRPGDGFDFFALREYVPGDTMRQINWKASARSGKMMVNQMERVTAAEVTMFIDGRAVLNIGHEDTAPRVSVARAAASFIDFLFKSKDTARVVIYSDHVREIEPQPAERMIPFVMEQMAELQPKGEFPLREAVRQVLPSLRPNTPVILISPLLDDGTIVEAASILLANGMILTVVTPELHELPGAEPSFASALLKEREVTIRELQSFGAIVISLEPGTSLAGAVEKARMVLG
ncbi:MAG: DUF58 domain-containing protein [Candidatus Thermoplasmatota archaeon]